MKIRILIIVGLVAALAVVYLPSAHACSCAAEWDIEDDYASSESVIFSGTVSEIKNQERSYLVTLDIIQLWKGIPHDTDTVNIMTAQGSASCGVTFEANQSYLVVGYGPWDQTPVVSICDSTAPLDLADSQISYLNDVTPVRNENASGQIEDPDKPADHLVVTPEINRGDREELQKGETFGKSLEWLTLVGSAVIVGLFVIILVRRKR